MQINEDKPNILIKIIFFPIILLFIYKNNNISYINIDNEIGFYENNINFSNYSSDIKAIALFLPQFHEIQENNEWWGKGFTEWKNVKKAQPLYKGHHQPRKPGDPNQYLNYYELSNSETLKKQINLAKSHGIYGFGIYYYWFSGKILLEKPLIILLNEKDIDFYFLLIWANENWTKKWDGKDEEVLIKQDYKENDPENFIKDIKKYIIDKRYIRINGKPIIGIYEPRKIPNINRTIFTWREKSKEYGIGEIYIIVCLNDGNFEEYEKIKLFNAVYQFSPRDSMTFDTLIKSKTNYYAYTAALYNKFNISDNILDNFQFYRGSMLEFDNSPRKAKDYAIFTNYSPEQFYRINKKIVDWTEQKYNKTYRFIFINAWNEWGEGTYLEPDDKFGYASINALSKAIFHIPYVTNYNLEISKNECIIAVQAHIYYEEFINDIINKTNNIPVKFDLYISTDSENKRYIIEEKIRKKSMAKYYQIKVYEKEGTDTVPFLLQSQQIIKRYKYICHLHTKKNNLEIFENFYQELLEYLFNNLLGSNLIISEILNDFEKNDKLGFIFPETFHKVLLQYQVILTKKDKYYMNYLFKKLNTTIMVGKHIEFPIGNMFWAKIQSIYQIFTYNLTNDIPKENNQIDRTIMHNIERIWLFLVKLNGYFYKKIFKCF
jgi:lipopolysaccharide biosynthesis protein